MKHGFIENNEGISAESICGILKSKEIKVCVLDSVDSTNNEARRMAERGDEAPALIIANSQSAGRGRMGRSFYSPSRTGLYMSLLLGARADIADNVRLTTAAAVAVCRSIDEICGKASGIKWVNDVYLDGRKICGILCESFSVSAGGRFAVVGIGLNLHTESFPKELADKAASLFPEGDGRAVFAASITDKLYGFYREPDAENIMEYYRGRSLVLGKKIIFTENGKAVEGFAEDVDDFGGLGVRLRDGSLRRLSGGEISLRLGDKGDIL